MILGMPRTCQENAHGASNDEKHGERSWNLSYGVFLDPDMIYLHVTACIPTLVNVVQGYCIIACIVEDVGWIFDRAFNEPSLKFH
jgi:hypothetical protein